MKVKLKTCMAGPEGTFLPGAIVEDNGDLVKGGYAEPLKIIKEIKATETVKEIQKKVPAVKPLKKGR